MSNPDDSPDRRILQQGSGCKVLWKRCGFGWGRKGLFIERLAYNFSLFAATANLPLATKTSQLPHGKQKINFLIFRAMLMKECDHMLPPGTPKVSPAGKSLKREL